MKSALIKLAIKLLSDEKLAIQYGITNGDDGYYYQVFTRIGTLHEAKENDDLAEKIPSVGGMLQAVILKLKHPNVFDILRTPAFMQKSIPMNTQVTNIAQHVTVRFANTGRIRPARTSNRITECNGNSIPTSDVAASNATSICRALQPVRSFAVRSNTEDGGARSNRFVQENVYDAHIGLERLNVRKVRACNVRQAAAGNLLSQIGNQSISDCICRDSVPRHQYRRPIN